MRKSTHVFEPLKTVGKDVDVFEVCINFGLMLTNTKKIAQKEQSQKSSKVTGTYV